MSQIKPIDIIVAALEARGKEVKDKGNGKYMAQSPLRDDKKPSLSIQAFPDGKVLLHDFAASDRTEDIVSALGLEMKDLFPQSNKPQSLNLNRPDEVYSYRDMMDIEVAQVLRFDTIGADGIPEKTFRQRHFDHDKHKWIWGAPPNIPLYRLAEVSKAHPDYWVFIPEGEKDVENLRALGLIATTNIGGANRKWTLTHAQSLAGKKVCILTDNDKVGLERGHYLAELLAHHAKAIKMLKPDDLGIDHIHKGDISDALTLGLVSATRLSELADDAPDYQATIPLKYRTRFGKKELIEIDFPDPIWLVKGLLPDESLVTFAGRPKIGKSWLILQMVNAIADGAEFLGMKTRQSKVAYFTLEDTPRRIQNRMIAQGQGAWDGVDYFFSWPNLLEGGLDDLRELIERDKFKLVVIDTISRVLPLNGDESALTTDIYGKLQDLTVEMGCSIILIDHHRKPAANAKDVIDDVTGTTAKSGVVDAVYGLYRPERQLQGQFLATGRDIEDISLNLEFNKVTGLWSTNTGISSPNATTSKDIHQSIIDAIQNLGDDANAQNIIDYLGLAKGYVYQQLKEMVDNGWIMAGGRGKPYIAIAPF